MTDPGMPVPADFAEHLRLSVHSKVRDKYSDQFPDLWKQFNGALGGLLYRITACAEHDEEFTSSVSNLGPAPPHPQRYYQERELFEFFVTGQSAVECLCYSLYALGAMTQTSTFDLFSKGKPQRISTETTKAAYDNAFGGQTLTMLLSAVIGSAKYKEWTDARNVLTHRMHPGRVISVGARNVLGSSEGMAESKPKADWIGLSIDSRTTQSRRQWLVEQVNALLKEADIFVDGLP